MVNLKNLCSTILSVIFITTATADEGMWMLNNLKQENWDTMKKLGFSLSENQLYDETNPSLKDAVVHFDGGCTGITVSGKGLIFTNHHCGYDAIQSQSSVENDYLKDGFVAQSQDQERPIPDMFVRYLVKTEDVTQRLFQAVDSISDEWERLQKIDMISKEIEDSIINGNDFIEAEVSSYFDRNQYYLNVYEVFKDIRMVFAPPSSVGKFGGDTDNWMWPRHTGDFSVFRVYANTENKPSEYNENNIPYQPKYFAPISLQGYKENDYSMTIGFPGRTNRYLSSWGVEQRVESSNTPRIEVRGIKQEIWKTAMLESDEIRIKYASKYARSSNYWKNSIGMNRGIEKMHVIEKKQATEKQFSDWVELNPERKAFFGNTINLIKDGYQDSDENQKALTYLYESLVGGTEITRMAFTAMAYDISNTDEDRRIFWEEAILPMYKDYDSGVDQKVLAAMLKIAKQRIHSDFLPHVFKDIDKKYKGDYDKYADDLFAKSVIPYPDKLQKMLEDPKKIKKLDKDPAYQFARSVREAFDAALIGVNIFRYDILQGERLFSAGLQQMNPDNNFASDANSTMRMSYGSIAGYIPYDGAWYDYYTTSKGVFEKYKKDDSEFDVQPEILDLLASQDFGKYKSEQGELNLCFLSNNDITGGNSGSPMFDGKGRVIGLAFDGNWEAMSGDIVFEPEVQKTIGVDIRYVMFMIDKWGKCNRILEEVTLE